MDQKNNSLDLIVENMETLLNEILLKGFTAFSNTELLDKIIEGCRWSGLKSGETILQEMKAQLEKEKKSFGEQSKQSAREAAMCYFRLEAYRSLIKSRSDVDAVFRKGIFHE